MDFIKNVVKHDSLSFQRLMPKLLIQHSSFEKYILRAG